MGRYDELVFPIPKEFHNWYGFASPRGFFRGTTMMDKAKIYLDFTSVTKELVMEFPHTHHAVDEYIVLATADFNHFFDGFDAEIDIWLGEDPKNMEMITVTQPVIIRIPPKLYHCPINFRRIGKPVLFSAMYCDGDWSKISPVFGEDGVEKEFRYDGAGIRRCVKDRSKECIYCGACFSENMKKTDTNVKRQEELMAPFYEMARRPRTGKYDKYVHAFVPDEHDDGRFVSPRIAFRGEQSMAGSRLWTLCNLVQKPCTIGKAPHFHHAVEEYLFFTGADITNFFDFDAKAEIALGSDPDHMEVYTITEPTVIRVPAGLWHGPVTFTHVGAPVNFMPFYPSGCYGRVSRILTPDGGTGYQYYGTELVK